jgi:hypothetical protein
MQLLKVKNNLHIIIDYRLALCMTVLLTSLSFGLVSLFLLSSLQRERSRCLALSLDTSQRITACKVDVELMKQQTSELLNKVTGKPERGMGGN